MVNDDDGEEYPSRGVFVEVVEPEKLVWTEPDVGRHDHHVDVHRSRRRPDRGAHPPDQRARAVRHARGPGGLQQLPRPLRRLPGHPVSTLFVSEFISLDGVVERRHAAPAPEARRVTCRDPSIGSDVRGESTPRSEETTMPKLRVHAIRMSLDGYVAGPDQSLENPLGVGGPALHEWVFATRTGREMIGEAGGERPASTTSSLARGFDGIGADDHGPQHVRPRARAVGHRRSWTGLVGRRAAVPPPGVRAHAPRARRRSRWRAARPSTSSPTASRPRSSGRSRRPAATTSGSAAAPRRCSSTCAPAWSTSSTSRSRPCCWAAASGSSTTSPGWPAATSASGSCRGASVVHALLTRRAEEGQAP